MARGQADYAALWRELSLRVRKPADGGRRQDDPWAERASRFAASARRRGNERDLLVDALADLVLPADAVLDIGAGIGRWTVPLARVAHRVTALDPSPAMLAVLKENAAVFNNITVVQGAWEEAEVGPHDVALCSHAMYGNPDLLAFVHKMERVARRLCALVLRVPSRDGVIGELSQLIHGRWHDSPNFVIALNILLDAGIYPNVLMEPEVRRWTDETIEDAVARAKRHLRLGDSTVHDAAIRGVVSERLVECEGRWVWPDGMRSALVWWRPSRA